MKFDFTIFKNILKHVFKQLQLGKEYLTGIRRRKKNIKGIFTFSQTLKKAVNSKYPRNLFERFF